ncbi:uncharacterized protein LOC132201321 [Neocloeon triangulifer]|uniref:uncharacterized protein LOC132201321 n=1 Tax=Neocloeon triangulifer TaxID=2078957 RepID=UPI00286F6EFA|nr:uncharacterized protein LOC132201321 [Neocloeon triangulifer]
MRVATFLLFALFSHDPALSNRIKTTDCPDFGKARPLAAAPIFTNDDSNLSFEHCGEASENAKSPWHISFFARNFGFVGDSVCSGALVSEKTVISSDTSVDCSMVHDEFVTGSNRVRVFGGATCTGGENCFNGRQSLGQHQKVANVTVLKINGFTSVYVWTLKNKVTVSEFLKPICLWNRNNLPESLLQSKFYQVSPSGDLKEVQKVRDEEGHLSTQIDVSECKNLNHTIRTTSFGADSSYLIVRRDNRFYVRGAFSTSSSDYTIWYDLLPQTAQIVAASTDLIGMPPIPKTKRKIDFGGEQSFAGCGQDSAERNPWHATFTPQLCAATLISKQAAVTAAHCLFDEAGRRILADQVHLTFGTVDKTKENEPTRQTVTTSRVVVHPEFDPAGKHFENDVALLIFEKDQIQINENVKPICLWNDGYSLDRISNKTGKVVMGLGEKSLQESSLEIIPYQDCYLTNPKFFSKNLRPTKNFCLAFAETGGSSDCVGGNGGAFVLHKKKTRRHFLRGLQQGREKLACNHKEISLFTDLTFHLDWIAQNTPDIHLA